MGRKKHKHSGVGFNRPSEHSETKLENTTITDSQDHSWEWNECTHQWDLKKEKIETVEIKKEPVVMSATTNKKIKQVKEFEDIMTCIFEHEVSKSSINYEWTGPKLGREMWNEVLGFFRWTYETTQSESQVRLYVNYKTKEWRAWAFPQTEGSGMTTREIENDAYKEQRVQFSDLDGWLYYGTVHHHCSASAFQSSTDEANERGQDGIHITIGKINSTQHDIDARLYQSGYKIPEWKIEQFWDPGDVYSGLPDHVKNVLPKDFPQRVVLMQMCTPPPINQIFPDIWKTNLIRIVHVVPKGKYKEYSRDQYFSANNYYQRKPFIERSQVEGDFDHKRFVMDVINYIRIPRKSEKEITTSDFRFVLNAFHGCMSLVDCDIMDIMLRNDIRFPTALDLLDVIDKHLQEVALEEELQISTGDSKMGKTKGNAAQGRLILPPGGNGPADNGNTGSEESMQSEGGSHYAGYGSGFGIGG